MQVARSQATGWSEVGDFAELIGTELGRGRWSWDEETVMLYAVAVGAGLDDPVRDLHLTTENTPGAPLQVLPSFLTQMECPSRWTSVLGWGDDPFAVRAVHGEQRITLDRPIPVSGAVTIVDRLSGVFDKGSGALVNAEKEIVLEATGERLGTSLISIFVQGKGGFGGPRNPPGPAHPPIPERAPDLVVPLPVGPNQSLIYRLLGDRNPHATEPGAAHRDGFERPVFFGRGILGVVCRALVRGLCDSNPDRLGHMEGRFSKPVFPGDRLDTRIWVEGDEASFQVLANGERVVFDRGWCRFGIAA